MSSIKKFNKETGKWEIHGTGIASEIALLDLEGNFQSSNVEGALRENAEKILEQEIKNNANNSTIRVHSSMIKQHEEDIEWLKENGGGGGGGSAPTITSTFIDGTIVEKDKDVEIPIFYSSPNLGDGLAYVVVNGVEIKTQTVKQGNNKINIGKLKDLKNEVSIYVKDRANKLSNQLSWIVVCGGIDLEVDFDSEADYSVNDVISMRYNVRSASDEPIIMHLTVDYDTYEVPCTQGHNEYIFKDLGVGIHKVSFYITSGVYKTSVETFNIVIVNATSLYVSSNFPGGEFEYGNPISINYRISKMGTEVFTVNLILDDVVVKTLRASAGSYYWTLNGAEIGDHTIKIDVTSDYGENAFTEKDFKVVQGEYTPLKINEAGLIYRLNAEGKTNNDVDRDNPVDSSGNGVKTTLHNFNYYTNGWIDDALVCDGNSYVEIDCYPYADNAIHGSTVEIQYKGLDIGFEDARIIDYTDIETPYKGFYIDLNESTIKSLANSGKVYVDKDAWTTLTFVIDRKNKFAKIFIDGICSRAFSLSDSGSGVNATREDFTHSQKIYLNSRKGIDKFGACEIKDVRVYDRVLSDDEILQNNIAQIKDMKKQKELFNKNYNNTSLPTIRMYGDMSNMTLETPVQMRIKYTSPNDELYGQSFDLPYCDVNWQGTSSLQYVLKNFTARLKDENMADFDYTPYPNGILENVYCFKCDYMESTHSRNTGLAKFVNECLYDSKNPAQLKNENIRNSINGFPCLMYINDELQGVYNFNLDRYSTKSYGYEDDGKCLVYEVSANSDTTAGAFYKWTQETGKDKLDYYKSDFECLFPPTRASGNDNMEELIRLVEWVNDSSDEDFRDNIHNYFNLEYLLRYYLYVLVVGAVDSLGKNMKLATWDGLIWYPQVYDADTTIGLDNTGFLKFDMDIEMGDPHVFNTTGSKLWQKVRVLFEKELQEQYAIMRQKHFTVENFMKYLLEEQIEQIPAKYYNIDMQTKYLNYGSAYLYALHGSSEHHIRKWLRERLIYVDTLLGYNVSTSDYITLRSSKLGEVYLDIETYIPMYVRVKWRDESGGTGIQVKRVARGEKVRFSYNMPTATDQEIIVYGGYYLKSIGDVSNLQPTTMLIANASRLTEIECHSPNLINTDLSECTKLQKIDLSDCTALGTGIGSQPILNIQNCRYLKYCNCNNTQLTAIYTMSAGGNLEEIYYPETTQIVQLNNQTYLRVVGIPRGENAPKNLAQVNINNCKNIEYIQYPYEEGENLDFDVFKYVQNLNIVNSLDKLKHMSFDGFEKMKTVSLSSMYSIEKMGFDDMLPVDATTNLQKIILSDMPLLDKITFNISSDDYKVAFAKNAIVDLGGLNSVKVIESNADIQGLDKIIVPIGLEELKLTGNNTMKSIWSANANHTDDNYEGIDFVDMENLSYINMSGLPNVKNAINFNISPKDINPNLNTYRDGSVDNPWFRPSGKINITNYTGDLVGLFRGLDLNIMEIQCDKNKEQTDASNLFEYILYDGDIDKLNNVLKRLINANVMKNIFKDSNISDITHIEFPSVENLDLEGAFTNLPISEDYQFTPNTVNVSYAFKGCTNLAKIHSNWKTEYNNRIIPTDCYSDCNNITHIDDIEVVVDDNNHCRDSIPKEWGGFGFDMETTSIFKIDTNLLATNTFILPSECVSVSWGDGTTTNGGGSHEYRGKGIYTIKMKHKLDTYEIFKLNGNVSPIIEIQQVAKIDSKGNMITNLKECFAYNNNLVSINLNNIRGNELTSLEGTFKNTPKLKTIVGLENLNLDNLDSLAETFMATSFENWQQIRDWNVGSVTTSKSLFKGNNLEGLDVSSWNMKNCINFESMFEGTYADINISNWTVKGNLSKMFKDCNVIIGIETLDLSNVDNLDNFMNGCKNTTIDLSNCNLKDSTSINDMFANMVELNSINLNNVSDKHIILIVNTLTERPRGIIYTQTIKHTYPKVKGWKYESNEDFCFLRYSFKNKEYVEVEPEETEEESDEIIYETTPIDVLPIFNEGFLYGYEDEVLGDITTRSIFIEDICSTPSLFDDLAVTPTIIKFTNEKDLLTVDKMICKFEDMENMFKGCSSLVFVDLTNVTTEKVVSMASSFEGCSSLQSIDLATFDTSNVENFDNIFKGCSNLKTIDISNLNIASTKSLNGIFNGCTKLSEIVGLEELCLDNINSLNYMLTGTKLTELDLSDWNLSNISEMDGIFKDCTLLTRLNLSNWNLQSVNSYDEIFEGCSSLNHIDMYECDDSTFNIIPPMLPIRNLDDLGYVYSLTLKSTYGILSDGWDYELEWEFLKYTCTEGKEFLPRFNGGFTYDLVDVKKNGITTRRFCSINNITPAQIIFTNGTGILTINKIKASVSTVVSMFSGCENVTYINVSDLDTSNCTSFSSMFHSCKKLTQIEGIQNLNTSRVTDLSSMFYFCTALRSLDLSGWDTRQVTTIRQMFRQANSLSYLNVSDWNVENLKTCNEFFLNAHPLKELDLSEWNLIRCEDFGGMFTNCGSLQTVGNLVVKKSAKNLSSMFTNCGSLKYLDVTNWDTSNVTSMGGLFNNCSSLTDLIGIENWNTDSLINLGGAFTGLALEELNLSNWNISKITSFDSLFSGCKVKTLNLSWGDKTKNKTSFSRMFENATTQTIIGIEDWDMSSATNLHAMFLRAKVAGELNLSKWDVSSVNNLNLFMYETNLTKINVTGWQLGNCHNVAQVFNYNRNCTEILGLEGWNINHITNLSNMLSHNSALTCELNLSSWDMSNKTNISNMFTGCGGRIIARGWDLRNITNIDSLFNGSTASYIDLSDWKTDNINSMSRCFNACRAVEIVGLNTWNMSSMRNMYMTFLDCSNLKSIELPSTLKNVTNTGYMAHRCGNLENLTMDGASFDNVTSYDGMLTPNAKLKTVSLVECSDDTISKVVNQLPNRSTQDFGTIIVSTVLSSYPTKTGWVYSEKDLATLDKGEPVIYVALTRMKYQKLMSLLDD